MSSFSRKEFLEVLFKDYFSKRDGFIMVRTGKHLDPRVGTRFFPNTEILSKEQYQEDQNVFFGVCPRETMKPDQRHVRYITAFWAGLDLNGDGYSGKDLYFFSKPLAAKAVRSFPLPPSVVVESGVGMHLYWLLQDVVEIDNVQRFENLLNKIGSHFQCKTPTKVDAVLRLPETYNCKVSAQGGICRVKFINADFRYALEDFDKLSLRNRHAAPAFGAQPSQAEASPERSLDVVQAHSDEREINDSEDLLEFLEPGQPMEKKGPAPRPVLQQPVRTAAPAGKGVQQPSALNAFEPTPYEAPFERPGAPKEPASRELPQAKPSPELDTPETGVADAVVEVVEEQSFEAIADRIVDRVVEKLSEKLMDKMVDQIVQKLAMELTMGGSRGRK